MDEFIEERGLTLEEFYKNPEIIDGTVWYRDYFDHAIYLRYALKEVYRVFNKIARSKPEERNRYTSLGLLYTVVFQTSQILENLIKSRALYDLKVSGRLKEFRTLQKVVDKYWRCQGHDIKGIIKVSNIIVTEKEKKLINGIEPYFTWGGRYPHPYSQKDFIKIYKDDIRLTFTSDTITIIDGMIERFSKEMEINEKLIDDVRQIGDPKPFCFNKKTFKAFVLGADPTNFSNNGKPKNFEYVFGILSDEPRYFSRILKNLKHIGLHLEEVYVQNAVRERLKEVTSKNKEWEKHALQWLPELRAEFDRADPQRKKPVLVTAERIMRFLTVDGYKLPRAKEIYAGDAEDLFCLSPDNNKLARPLYAFYRHKAYNLSTKQHYASLLKAVFDRR